jgi:hypothetical protein
MVVMRDEDTASMGDRRDGGNVGSASFPATGVWRGGVDLPMKARPTL